MLQPAGGPEPVQTLQRKKQGVYVSIRLRRAPNEAVASRILQLTRKEGQVVIARC